MKKTPRTGSRYAALTGQGLDIKAVFPTSETSPILFSSSPPEVMLESEELWAICKQIAEKENDYLGRLSCDLCDAFEAIRSESNSKNAVLY